MTSAAAPVGARLLGVGLTPQEVALWLASDDQEVGWEPQARDRARGGRVEGPVAAAVEARRRLLRLQCGCGAR